MLKNTAPDKLNEKGSAKNLIRESWENIYRNKFSFLIGASILHFLITSIGLNALFLIFKAALFLTRQPSLNKDNFYTILTNPFGFSMAIIYILVVAFLTFIEFSILITMINSRRKGNPMVVREVLKTSFVNLRSLLGVQFIFFLIYFIMMVPLENLGLSSTITEKLYIPSFITGEISKTTLGELSYFCLMVGLFYFNFRLIFTLPLSILNKKTLAENLKISWKITRKHKLKLLIGFAVFEAIFAVIGLVVVLVATVSCNFIDKDGGNLIVQTVFYSVIDGVIFAFAVMTKIAIINMLLIIQEEESVVLNTVVGETNEEQKRRSRILSLMITIFILGAIIVNGSHIYHRKYNERISLIAHRGDIYGGVENSLEALKSAAQKGAKFVEMDIQLTRDGHFVVVHDYNLGRLAGEYREVKDMTLAEIRQLTTRAGSFESKIPTFEEYAIEAKKLGVNLFIELKPNPRDNRDYADLFVYKMRELKIERRFKAMSLNMNLIRRIEAIAPEIETGFVIPLQIGDFDNSKVDFYAIEDFSYNPILVENAHKNGRKIFVWTINNENRITKYLQSPVDGIITDELDEFTRISNSLKRRKDTYFERLLRVFF